MILDFCLCTTMLYFLPNLNELTSGRIDISNIRDLNIDEISKKDEIDFVEKIYPVYKAINLVRNNQALKNKSTIGFVGAPWTLLVYMINKQSPKLKLKDDFFKDN